MSSYLSFTLLLQYSIIFCWYFAIMLEALSLTSSRQSRLSRSLSSFPSLLNDAHLVLVTPTLTGITASVPQVSLKGVSSIGAPPYCGPVRPKDIGQLFWPGTLCIIQLGFDNLEQCPIRHFRLSICLRMPWRRELVLNAQTRTEISKALAVELSSII